MKVKTIRWYMCKVGMLAVVWVILADLCVGENTEAAAGSEYQGGEETQDLMELVFQTDQIDSLI